MPYATDALIGTTVLVVEDQYFLADAIVAAIASAGGDVLGPFATRREALDCLVHCKPQPSAAALNVQLEDGDSFPIADELAGRGVPFVFASGNADLVADRFANVPRVGKPYAAAQVVARLAGVRGNMLDQRLAILRPAETSAARPLAALGDERCPR